MRLVIVSCGPDEAERLLDSLLEERLVGCGNILSSVRSHYWWEGRIHRDEESLLLMETEEEKVPRLLERVPELHSYDVPKIIVLDITESLPAYGGWLRGVLTASS
jgi:periplasmic divalent cation tolerance protein